VLDLGKPVIALLTSGRPLAVPWLFERADAVLTTWFLGKPVMPSPMSSPGVQSYGKLAVTWLPRRRVPIFLCSADRPARGSLSGSRFLPRSPVTPQFPSRTACPTPFTLRDLMRRTVK
jgi:beta-glucosidase